MSPIVFTIVLSAVVCLLFIIFQVYYFLETRKRRILYSDFFDKEDDYKIIGKDFDGTIIPQIKLVGPNGSDLNKLLSEINHYIVKTKGTTDFAVIQNKVERMINMRYELAESKLSFPTHIGLMGTFFGVIMGISMFVRGFDGQGDVRDEAIIKLLIGVLVSMLTSLVGLFLTTCNSAKLSDSQKAVEEDKNAFYDFIQTELMPSLDVSLVVAISKLHDTVNKFEPAFNNVIDRFQGTFDSCTRAFGESFEKNVRIVSNAVKTMGENMDKINENIELQKSVLSTFKSDEVVRGLEKYVEAADHFVSITQSLNKFEEARRMMLAAAQEAIEIQNSYSESLKIPREIAVRINSILDRIKSFEDNLNRLGDKLNEREILGNDVVNAIRNQVNSIDKRSKIADSYLQVADGKLEDLFHDQTQVIDNLNKRYSAAINEHINGFEKLIEELTEEIQYRHKLFLSAMEENLNVDVIHEDFSNLGRLEDILDEMRTISNDLSTSREILYSIEINQKSQEKVSDKGGTQRTTPVVVSSTNDVEIRRLRNDNQDLRNNIERLKIKLEIMEEELKKQKEKPSPSYPVHPAISQIQARSEETHNSSAVQEEKRVVESQIINSNRNNSEITNSQLTINEVEKEQKCDTAVDSKLENLEEQNETLVDNSQEEPQMKGLIGFFKRMFK